MFFGPLKDLDVDGVALYVSYLLKVPVVSGNHTQVSLVIGHGSYHSTVHFRGRHCYGAGNLVLFISRMFL